MNQEIENRMLFSNVFKVAWWIQIHIPYRCSCRRSQHCLLMHAWPC